MLAPAQPTIIVPRDDPALRDPDSTDDGDDRNGHRPAEFMPMPFARRRRSRRGVVTLILVLAATLGLSGAAWWAGAGPGAYTETPALARLTEEAARTKAAESGLRLNVTGQFDEKVRKGVVMRTDPIAGHRIRKRGSIKAFVSLGPERYGVPDVAGMSLAEARAALSANKLTPGSLDRGYSETVPAGRVLRSEPAAGTQLQRNRAVVLVLSLGPAPVRVPGVVGQDVGPAEQALRTAGFEVKRQDGPSESQPAGKVFKQSPAKGRAKRGSTVTVWVSTGPPPVVVPDVVGKTLPEASKLLTDAGLAVGRVFDLPGGEDRVLDQNPDAGTTVPKGSPVDMSAW
jgi:serine/threonine-protein kinase